MKKICSYCKEEKDVIYFGRLSSKYDKINPECKKCRGLINKKSREKHKEKYKEKTKVQNKKRKEYKAEWFQENKERIKGVKKTPEQEERNRKYKAEWFQENKERLMNKQLEKRRTDPKTKINHLISGAILKCLGKNKNGNKWTDIVGYTAKDLLNHFSVDKIPEGYHIDHIIPINLYNYSSIDDEFLKCWNIRNLRIIPAKDNLSKGDKLDKILIAENNIIDLLPKEIIFEELQ